MANGSGGRGASSSPLDHHPPPRPATAVAAIAKTSSELPVRSQMDDQDWTYPQPPQHHGSRPQVAVTPAVSAVSATVPSL